MVRVWMNGISLMTFTVILIVPSSVTFIKANYVIRLFVQSVKTKY